MSQAGQSHQRRRIAIQPLRRPHAAEKPPVDQSTKCTTVEAAQPKTADYQHPAHVESASSPRPDAFQHGSSGYQEAARSDRTGEASTFLRQEFHLNAHLSPDRVWVLESALALVKGFVSASHAVNTHHGIALGSDGSSNTEIPRELFHMMLDDHRNDNYLYYHWPDHLPLSVLEKFCIALDRGTVSDHVALHYRLCVFSKATAYTNRRLRFCRPGFMADVDDLMWELFDIQPSVEWFDMNFHDFASAN